MVDVDLLLAASPLAIIHVYAPCLNASKAKPFASHAIRSAKPFSTQLRYPVDRLQRDSNGDDSNRSTD